MAVDVIVKSNGSHQRFTDEAWASIVQNGFENKYRVIGGQKKKEIQLPESSGHVEIPRFGVSQLDNRQSVTEVEKESTQEKKQRTQGNKNKK